MISLYFGSPGAGKTTLAARIVYKELRKKKPKYNRVYTNFECVGSYEVKSEDFAVFKPYPHSLVIIDEAGIDFNNRKYNDLKQSIIEFLKLHRHYQCDIIFLSQSWEDCDITIRRLAEKLIYIKKIGPFTLCRRVRKFVRIDKEKEDVVYGYAFWGMLEWISFILNPIIFDCPISIFLRSPYYFMFDSYSIIERPIIPRGKYKEQELTKHIYSYGISTAYLRLKHSLNSKLKIKR